MSLILNVHSLLITLILFVVRKSVHHHTIQINQPTRCNCFSRDYYSTYMCGSTCFGRLPAHHHEHTTALGTSGSTFGRKRLERSWSWLYPARPRPTTLQSFPSKGRTRGSWCSCMLLMMGVETPKTCWATYVRRVINSWKTVASGWLIYFSHALILVKLNISAVTDRNFSCVTSNF
jgi:hypothetical protein